MSETRPHEHLVVTVPEDGVEILRIDREEALGALYTEGLRALKPKFDLYEKGNRVNHHPWLGDLLIRRARKSQRLRNRMAAVLEERATPAQLITLRGLVKLFTE